MKSTLIAFMTIVLCVPNAVSQEQSGTMETPDRTLGAAEVYYLKAKNKTRAQVTLHLSADSNARNAAQDTLRMDVIFELKGLKVVRPQYFFIAFSAYSLSGPKYRNTPLAIYTRDIKGFTNTIYGTRMLSQTNKPGGETVEVFVSSRIPYNRFLEIIEALDTKITVGARELKLNKENVKAIGDLNRTIEK